jgi:hypothetical protein
LNNVGQTARFQLEGTSNDTNKLLIVSNFSSATNAVGAGLYLARAGSTAVGSNVVVAAGNQLGEVVFSGSDGTDFVQAALIKAEVDGTPGANDMPGRIVYGASSPTERMRIDSAGRVGIGTSSPAQKLEIQDGSISIGSSSNVNATNVLVAGYGYILSGTKYGNTSIRSTYSNSTNAASLEFYVASLSTSTAEAMRITSAGLVGIGTSAPASKLVVSNAGAEGWELGSTSGTVELLGYNRSTSARSPMKVIGQTFLVQTGNPSLADGLYQDSSGRVGIGNTVPSSFNSDLNRLVVGSGSGSQGIMIYAGTASTANLTFHDTVNASLSGMIRYDHSSDAMSFWTNGVTERMRIRSDGTTLIGKTTGDDTVTGVKLGANAGDNVFTVGSGASWALMCNRQGDDGTLILFRQANTSEGSISVSGTTVSYNGAHLSRWSQLPSGAERTEILRGSVLSNIDEMCEWGEEDNEQLNRMKVSDVEGDKNVSGVFQAWDDEDDTYVNDFYCAMTGDFIIRIAEGVTVERGDLLMSAGDGTAKPQDDDIIRSKTIAKVTSINVSCTYNDGSYCVPCVLMAC